MGRRAKTSRLNIWMNGIPVGYWETTRGSANHYLLEEIQRRHWVAQARQVGLEATAAERLLEAVITATDFVIGEVGKGLPDDFPMDMAEAVFGGMRKQSAQLAAGC